MKDTESLTGQAYQHLKLEVLSGRIPAGSQVDAKAIGDALGVSRTPVREAMLRLANEGVLEVNSRRGVRVLPLSVNDLRSIYQVITAIEVEAVFLLASCDTRDESIAELEAATSRMASAITEEDGEKWNLADESFHRALLRGSGNTHLAEAGNTYRDIAQRAHFVALRLVPLSQKARSADAHTDLIKKIAAGDAFNARELHRTQRDRGGELLVTALRTLRLDQL